LIAVERDPAHPRDVNYKTTARFLSLFDIRSLDELPRHEQVSYK
jgi:chromosome segregation and condensation protein ScpB